MNFKDKLVKTTDYGETVKEYKTLKEISDELNVEIHMIRKINKLSENQIKSERPHKCHKELLDKIKICNIKKTIKFKKYINQFKKLIYNIYYILL